jgi:hypothetical protein
VARPRYPRSEGPLPPPLPPATRTVGQLVAEAIKLYGERFWRVLPLGLAVAILEEAAFRRGVGAQTLLLWVFAPVLTLSYAGASALAARRRLTPRAALVALAVGLLVFAPFPVLLRLYVLPGLAWFALVGLAVPAAVIEGRGPGAALRRGLALGRADFVHALGSLCALGLVFIFTKGVLFFLLRGAGEAADRVAIFASDLVLSPLVFLGAALVYFDQAARVGLPRGRRSVRSSADGR